MELYFCEFFASHFERAQTFPLATGHGHQLQTHTSVVTPQEVQVNYGLGITSKAFVSWNYECVWVCEYVSVCKSVSVWECVSVWVCVRVWGCECMCECVRVYVWVCV